MVGVVIYIFMDVPLICWREGEMRVKGGDGVRYGWLIMGGQLSDIFNF